MYLLNVEHEALKVLGRQGLSRLAPGEELIDLGPLLELAHEQLELDKVESTVVVGVGDLLEERDTSSALPFRWEGTRKLTDLEASLEVLATTGDIEPATDAEDALEVEPTLALSLLGLLIVTLEELALDLGLAPLLPHPGRLPALLNGIAGCTAADAKTSDTGHQLATCVPDGLEGLCPLGKRFVRQRDHVERLPLRRRGRRR
jgi:hypothetical protein